MSLKQASNGETVKIVSINASHSYVSRLSALGVLPGREIRVIDNSLCAASLVDCMGARLVLGRGLPDRIIIK